MSKKLYLLISILAVLFIIFRFGIIDQTPFLWATNGVKYMYQGAQDSLVKTHNKFLNQAYKIEELTKINKQLKEDNAVLNAFAAEVVNLSKLKKYDYSANPSVKTVRAISYAALPDFNKIWIDFPEFEKSNLYGLIYNGAAAGIVVKKNGSSALALLNGDSKCSYAVYVGKKKIPGVAIGRRSNLMNVRYIPIWADIKVGDEVITSGLDKTFFEGIKVGKVTKILTKNAYKEVEIQPYYKASKPDFFYLVTKTL